MQRLFSTPFQSQRLSELIPVHVARRVLENMVNAALRYPDDETGEALIGFMVPDAQAPQRVYVLDTIGPGDDAVRAWAMFEQGSDWQGDVFHWYHENWELYRLLRRPSYGNAVAAKWDLPLLHLGDWHKQPGDLINPSRGDFRTAKSFMKAVDLDAMLTPIVTYSEPSDVDVGVNTILAADATLGLTVRIDFWIIHKQGSRFEPVQPLITENQDLPRLPPIPWHLANPARYKQELALLAAGGIIVLDIVQRQMQQHPPLDTCLVLQRQHASYVIIAVTAASYPYRAPHWRIAPLVRPQADEDLFEVFYRASAPVKHVLPNWNEQMQLLDGIRAIEEQYQQ